MIRYTRIVLLLVALAGLWAATPRSPEAAATPAPLGDKAQARHEQLVAKAKLGGYGLVMIGDSITDWEMVKKGWVNEANPAESRMIRAMIGDKEIGHKPVYDRTAEETLKTLTWIGNGALYD